ncbi:MAG: T9SS type A sorting domain-containing protein [Crocinitomicaceae bacterium]
MISKIIFTSVTLLISFFLMSQSPKLKWAKQYGGSSNFGERIADMTVDKSNYSLSVGWVSDSADINPGSGTYIYTNLASQKTGYVQKLNVNGGFSWGFFLEKAFPTGVVTDSLNNIFITGLFEDTVDFDPSIDTFNLISSGNRDVFVIKLDYVGNLIWAKGFGSQYDVIASAIEIDDSSNIYLTGNYKYNMNVEINNVSTSLSSNGISDAYVTKIDSNGSVIWLQSFGGNYSDGGQSISLDSLGNIYTIGYYNSSLNTPIAGIGQVDFDPGPDTLYLNAVIDWIDDLGNLHTDNISKTYIQKLTNNGELVWANSLYGWNTIGSKIIANKAGKLWITGTYSAGLFLDPISLNHQVSSNGGTDIFLTHLKSNGDFLWGKSFGGNSNSNYSWQSEGCWGIDIDNDNNAYLVGSYFDTVNFGSSQDTLQLISHQHSADGFVLKINSNGNSMWVQNLTSNSGHENTPSQIEIDLNNNLLVSGLFSEVVDFDPSIDISNLTAIGNQNIFIEKICECELDKSITFQNGIFTANESNADYQWMFFYNGSYSPVNNNVAISNLKTFTPVTNATYAVQITKNGCTEISDHYILTNLALNSVDDFKINSFPNPSSNGLVTTTTNQPGLYQVCVYDAMGKKILAKSNISDPTIKIFLPSSGIYFLEIRSGQTVITKKLIRN